MSRRRRRRKKKKNLPIVALLVLLVAIVGMIIFACLNSDNFVESETSSTPVVTAAPSPTVEPTVEPTAEATAEPTPSPTPVPEDPFLILVNYDNPIPDGYEDTIELVKCGEKFVDSRIYDDLTAMMTEAQKYGSLWIASAFRDTATQESVLENAIVKRMSDYGWTREEATEDALLVIAQPGESEHNTGLAVDFNYVEYGFEDTAVYEWLSENCADYGFVERYTIDKEDITQINYEPWHYRYVGVENAQAMEELGMCLEEYVDYYYGNEE